MAKYVLKEQSDGEGRPDFFQCCKCKNLFECYTHNFYIKHCPMCGDKLNGRIINSILEPLERDDLDEYERRWEYAGLKNRLETPIIDYMKEYLQNSRYNVQRYRHELKLYYDNNCCGKKPNIKDFATSWKDFKKNRRIY